MFYKVNASEFKKMKTCYSFAFPVNSDFYFKAYEDAKVDSKWVAITEVQFNTAKPSEPEFKLSELDIIGQQLVEKDLQIMVLQQENEILGQQIVGLDLRLLQGGL